MTQPARFPVLPRPLLAPSVRRPSAVRRSVAGWLFAAALAGGALPARAQEPIRRFQALPARAAHHREPRLIPVALADLPRALAAGTAHSWEELARTVKTGRRVGVWLADSTVVKGEVVAIDERSITVRQRPGPRIIPSAQVTRVRYLTHASRNAFLAGLVGADATCALLESRDTNPQPAECLDMGSVFLGLPIGGIASLAVRGPALYQATPVP